MTTNNQFYPSTDQNKNLNLRNASRFLLLVFSISLFTATARCSANDVYLAQSANGAGDGTSCSSPKAISFFNSSSNWGSGSTQIGPGTTVHLCGSISSDFSFQGDGASGNPVVLDGTGATVSAHLSTNGKNYWTIRKVTWSTSFPTDCSIVLNIPGGSFGSVESNTMDVRDPGPIIFLAQNSSASGLSHDITIQDNLMRNAPTTTACQSDLIDTEGSYNVTIQGNQFEMRSQNNDQHDDIIQTYQKGGATAGPPRDWTIRNNYLIMNTTAPNNKSWMMMEALTGTVNIYGNLFVGLKGGDSGNGICFNGNTSGLTANIVGNTVIQKAGGPNNLFSISDSGTFNLKNNIIYNTDAGNALIGNKSPNRSNNLWFGTNIPSCSGTDICGKNPLFTNFAGNDFTLLPTSPALAAGANLGASYNLYPVSGSVWPAPTVGTRPSAGAWDIGAYLSASVTSTAPAPPTGLSATVQ